MLTQVNRSFRYKTVQRKRELSLFASSISYRTSIRAKKKKLITWKLLSAFTGNELISIQIKQKKIIIIYDDGSLMKCIIITVVILPCKNNYNFFLTKGSNKNADPAVRVFYQDPSRFTQNISLGYRES